MKSPARAVLATLAFIATSLIALPAHAVGAQDQVVTGTSNQYMILSSSVSLGQSFTSGLTGNLDRVTIDLFKSGSPGNIVASIYQASNGTPSGAALASQSINSSAVGTSVSAISIDFSSPAFVTAGVQYILALEAFNTSPASYMMGIPASEYTWRAEPSALSGGEALTNQYSVWSRYSSTDFRFSTYVSPAQQAQTITWAPTNTSATTNATTLTPNTLATTNGDGAITYTVQDAGTTGCTLSNTPPSISFTSTGTCVIRANAAATAGYTAASLDVTFTISESLITPVVANSSLTTLADTGASSHLNWSLPLIGMGFVLAVVGVLILRIARQRIH